MYFTLSGVYLRNIFNRRKGFYWWSRREFRLYQDDNLIERQFVSVVYIRTTDPNKRLGGVLTMSFPNPYFIKKRVVLNRGATSRFEFRFAAYGSTAQQETRPLLYYFE